MLGTRHNVDRWTEESQMSTGKNRITRYVSFDPIVKNADLCIDLLEKLKKKNSLKKECHSKNSQIYGPINNP